ncbi:F0F1 ATP synthase subunit delta [Helicobacter mehlei]|uniref:ATP synthase subunit delta n=1 Tax=Helicobacter mehlei TaxID=2316080 RepID=A0A553V3B2_9HELI|nr:F0F1 ATP synthase subunit delta [Helicobacter mehlei]TSA86978.1 F0F1 ATP synthase subunit delta [Helicobacter mehlei]
MIELVAKKYAKALQDSFQAQDLEQVVQTLEGLVAFYDHAEFVEIIHSPYYPSSFKEELLTSVLEEQDSRVRNLIRLLATHKRLGLLPHIYQDLLSWIQEKKSIYRGFLYTNQEVSLEQLKHLEHKVSDRLEVGLSLKVFVDEEMEGIKLDIPGLGLEIAFYRDNFFAQLKHHIMEAV